MNLCDSGIADCYTGRSVAMAERVIRAQRPDVVTLNEICRDDLSVLESAMTNPPVTAQFRAAVDRRTGAEVRCRNGQPYGIGLLAHRPVASPGDRSYGGVYPAQDVHDPEERVWLCDHAVGTAYACVTHLASTSATVALAQCRYLLDTAIPGARRNGGDPVLLGADLNLRSAARSCLPRGYRQADDGAAQHVVVAGGFAIGSRRTIGMNGTTDHPALLVDLVRARPDVRGPSG